MTITLTKKQYKELKKEIVCNSAIWVGFNYDFFNIVNHDTLMRAIDEAVCFRSYSKMSIADKNNFLATEIVKNSNYQEFKVYAPYFFSFASYARSNRDKLLATPLLDDDTPYGGTSYAGETLADFLDEIGKTDNIPYTYSDEWLEEVNTLLVENGIKPLK